MTNMQITAAMQLAEAGTPVFPCRPNEKAPLTAHGFRNATTDIEIVTKWWRRWPAANIGVPTGLQSTFDVLDVDYLGPQENGYGALRRIRDLGLATDPHRVVRTPRGGLHAYYRTSGNTNHSNGLHHLDVRGLGGYVLVAPSEVNGVAYRVEVDRPDAQGTLDWPGIVRALSPRRPPRETTRYGATPSTEALVRFMSGAREGSRNSSLFWACCRLAEKGVANIAAYEPLVDTAVSLGLPHTEAERVVQSALRTYGAAA